MTISRTRFLRSAAGLGAGLWLGGPRLAAGSQSKQRYDLELVRKFVGAGHNDLEKTKAMLEEHPNLLNSAWDWGGGDFETAIGGAGHVGNREIAEFLISRGARVNLFVLTMLGKTELVRPVIEAYPELLHAKGPHGFSLLHHANSGGEHAEALRLYLREQGLSETKFTL